MFDIGYLTLPLDVFNWARARFNRDLAPGPVQDMFLETLSNAIEEDNLNALYESAVVVGFLLRTTDRSVDTAARVRDLMNGVAVDLRTPGSEWAQALSPAAVDHLRLLIMSASALLREELDDNPEAVNNPLHLRDIAYQRDDIESMLTVLKTHDPKMDLATVRACLKALDLTAARLMWPLIPASPLLDDPRLNRIAEPMDYWADLAREPLGSLPGEENLKPGEDYWTWANTFQHLYKVEVPWGAPPR